MTFEEAITEIKKGKTVFRKNKVCILDISLSTIEYFTLTQEDILAEDWEKI